MADDDIDPGGARILSGPGPAYGGQGAVPPPVDEPDPGVMAKPILSTSFKTPPQAGTEGTVWGRALGAVKDNLVENYKTAGQPVVQGPVISPLFSGIDQGVRSGIDWAAHKLAAGGEAILGNAAKSLPGYRSAGDIAADIAKRKAEYEANPDNNAGGVGSTIGQGIGTGIALGGPLTKIGGLAAGALRSAGATAIPAVARALEYLGGGARAAPDATRVAQLATRAGSLSAQGAATGGATAAIEADPNKAFLPQVAEGAAGGAVLGPVAGGVMAAGAYPVKALMGKLPGMVDDSVVGLADRFRREFRIDVDPSMMSQNPTYRIMADQGAKLPFSGAQARIDATRLQWQGAVAREMGEQTERGVTHDVMERAANRIGPGMNAIADRTTIRGGQPLVTELTDIANDIPRFGLTEHQLPPVQAQLRNVSEAFANNGGQITGRQYQNLVQTDGPLDTAINSTDPTIHAFGMRIKNALDNAFQRSAAPGDAEALRQLRYQYRVMKTVQPLVEQKGATGNIEPNGLLARVRAQSAKFDPSTGGVAYTGGGRLGELASGGQIFFGKPADSNTTTRAILSGLTAGSVPAAIANPWVPAGTAAGLLANRGLQSIMRSPGTGANMIENTLHPPGPSVQRATPYVVPGLLGY